MKAFRRLLAVGRRTVGALCAAVLLVSCSPATPPRSTLGGPTAQADVGDSLQARSGASTYREVCAACHDKGVADAPRIADHEEWEDLIEEGQEVLTAHAWVGVRGMPPRGGSPDLSLEEFARAVAYMARAAGGDWQDPDTAMLRKIRDEEEARRREQQGSAR